MNEYIPQYPIIDQADMVHREELTLVPEEKLSPFDRAELTQLRSNRAAYKMVVADTPENRQNISVKTTYFQMVAYAEGWEFKPEKYQVMFVEPNHPWLSEEGTTRRVWQFEEGSEVGGLSSRGRAGYTLCGKTAEKMIAEEADGLAERVIKLFGE